MKSDKRAGFTVADSSAPPYAESPAKLITQWPWKYDRGVGMVESAMPNLRDEYEHVCDLRLSFSGYFSHEDGQLLAAAPELLWALKQMLKVRERQARAYGNKTVGPDIVFAREAIKKAEGANEQ